jgi:hypothetical protein
MFEKGEVNFRDLFSAAITYESNIAYTLRFMIDTNARAPCKWRARLTTADRLSA